MAHQDSLRPSRGSSDRPSSPAGAWGKHPRKPTAGISGVEPLGRRGILRVGVPGSVCVPLLQNPQSVTSNYSGNRCGRPTAVRVAVVRGSAFDQATRMLFLAMVHAVSRARSRRQMTWMQKMATGLTELFF